MILNSRETCIAYRCPYCGSGVKSLVGVFSLSGEMKKLKCDCGASELTINLTNDGKLRITVPCMFCDKEHSFVISSKMFFDRDLFVYPCPYSGIDIVFIGKVDAVEKALDSSEEELKKILKENGIDDLEKLHGDIDRDAEDAYLGGLSEKIRAVEKQTISAELTNAVFVTSASMVLKLGIASVALAGSVLLINGSIDVLTLFMFLLVASRLYDPMQGALNNLAAVIAMRTNAARMNEILEYPIQTGSEELSNQGCDIVFDHVGFAYDSGETVLKDVSFTAKQGEVTALVGPSGGGKTTVSRLAARFWDHQKGSITVGGMDISKVDPEKLMGLYSIVFQDVTLFDNSILENIRLGRKDATDEEVLEAARLANCDEFAEKLPEGWNTDIGENGCALSGGERQRISIARAFLKDAPIILLDEATASLDVENETLIQTALSRLIQNKTVLIIAHRMCTVAGADKIVVLSDGVVAEQGAPDALYAQNGLYTHMVQLQTGSQNWTI